MKNFYQVLINTMIANVTTSFLWFALSFWVYLETKSVLATGLLGGGYMLCIALASIPLGTIVDHIKKKRAMLISSLLTLGAFGIAGVLFVVAGADAIADITSPLFWLFAALILVGAIVEHMRNIALSTTVTLLVPKERHAKANGMVGTVQGISFLITSVLSGLAIAYLGMGGTVAIAVVLIFVALVHLSFVAIPEKGIVHDPELKKKRVDIAGSLAAIRTVPGLLGLIIFSMFNNLIGGTYMALLDPYGLEMFSVEQWGIVYGISSIGFILGGGLVAKFGLGKNPIRTMLYLLIATGFIGMVFTIREAAWLLVAGMLLYMMSIPAIESAEQTVIQGVVPYKRQGRVFGFAMALESIAAPITAFLIAPFAEFFVIPYMKEPEVQAHWSWLFGTGDARGIALIFFGAGGAMIILALLAFRTKAYHQLSQHLLHTAKAQ